MLLNTIENIPKIININNGMYFFALIFLSLLNSDAIIVTTIIKTYIPEEINIIYIAVPAVSKISFSLIIVKSKKKIEVMINIFNIVNILINLLCVFFLSTEIKKTYKNKVHTKEKINI